MYCPLRAKEGHKHTVVSRVSAHGHLKFTGKKTGVGRLHGEAICKHTYTLTMESSKDGGWALTQRWAFTRETTVLTRDASGRY